MELTIRKAKKILPDECIALVSNGKTKWADYGLSQAEIGYLENELKSDKSFAIINQYSRCVFVYKVEKKSERFKTLEACRKAGERFLANFRRLQKENVTVVDVSGLPEETLCFVEGLVLANYQFLRYKKDPGKDKSKLKFVDVIGTKINEKQVELLNIVCDATCRARDLVNTTSNFQNPVALSQEFVKMGKEAGFSVEVFNKSKIESLKMGGLLAVNKGSVDPPTFSVMEYKPARTKNKKPYLLVGKGVVYDTGGLSLKPTLNSMDYMKSDMAGAAAVAATIFAVAKAKLPLHLIALVPATDNRPGGNAIAPGDVITMHNGVTVEVLNTDAEGRLILGDALSYAQQYDPELVIDLATLTGAAIAAVAQYGIVCMGNATEQVKNKLKSSANQVYERLAELPFWDEYGELIKSDIAEIKNIGGPYAGAITAGKFLGHFVNYPWMHFDIAGPSYLHKDDSYRGKAGTGVGVRLLFDFLMRQSK